MNIRLTISADSAIWMLLGLAETAAGMYFFYRGFRLLQRKRLILDTPTSAIRGAALGAVEVGGSAVGPYTLISPLSELECYFYRAVAWQGQGSGTEARWKKAAEETLCVPFFLDDGTGRVLVDPRGAEMELFQDFSEELCSPIAEYLRHFLGRHGISTDWPVKLEEYCIKPQQKLFVFGTLRENLGIEFMAEPSARAFRRLSPGFISSSVADLERRSALPAGLPLPQWKPSATSTQEFDLNPPVILMKGKAEAPFLISWRSQGELLESLAWKSTLYIWGGPVILLACAWLILLRFGLV